MLIVNNMLAASQLKAPGAFSYMCHFFIRAHPDSLLVPPVGLDFDSIIDDYLPRPATPRGALNAVPPPPTSKAVSSDYYEGLL
jgi:hypothetical protein